MRFAVRELLMIASLWSAAASATTTVTFTPVADTTIFGDNWQAASGADDNFFVGDNGTTGGFAERRALLRFDLSSIPSDAVIQNVSLTLNVTRTNAGNINDSVYRLTHSWGEGTSTAGQGGGMGGPATTNSATWIHRFFDTTLWDQAGGDVVGVASATKLVGGVGPYIWTSAAMASDVQSWVQNPANNQGWILIAETQPAGVVTAKRFASREFANAAQRPALSITYDLTGATAGDAPLPLWSIVALTGALLFPLLRRRAA